VFYGTVLSKLEKWCFRMKIYLSLSIVCFLAACGGGSVNPSGPSFVDNGNGMAVAKVVKYSDGSGAARAKSSSLASGPVGGSTVIAISDDIEKYLQNVSETEVRALVDLSLPLVDGNYLGGAKYYEGQITVADEVYTVSVFETKEDTSGVLAVGAKTPSGSGNLENLGGIAVGSEVSNIPVGQHSYSGVQIIASRYFERNGLGEVATTGWGTFTMDVDFTSGSGTYRGNTGTGVGGGNVTSLIGDVSINISSGEFSGNSLALSGNINGNSLDGKSANLEGNFHGDGATGVSGLFYTDSLEYGGGFVGSRDN